MTRFDVKIFAPGSILFDVAQFLQIGNSLINPVVYCFRMPEFRTTIFSAMFSGQNSQRLQFRECQTSNETNGGVLL